ncbi:hypothetical protein EPA93_13555 [Ktedonosporobacter rubrisoli]|uniref:HTH luxR-type domain-containing protein n=1 Tax=Ktedonosporobacter rubrisoli TaxID=2509675 RepID=A0A4P6JNU8_KTERU|nr:LuxR C-terminal-related transcriptional regulator [Ktedonosporobacter rubrisoli]QBD76974.1 hypothetical protein EPA93_13555 [Ktedonosporobacter rubrisoli]
MQLHNSIPLPYTIIARTQELALFRDCLKEATLGAGSLLLLSGELGVGKTVLARLMLQEARREQVPNLLGRSSELLANVPYGLWRSAFAGSGSPTSQLSFLLSLQESDTATTLFTHLQQLEAWLREVTTNGPLVILLEDIHEADVASLDLLHLLAQSIASLPVVLLLTYRTEAITRLPQVARLLALLAREARAKRVPVQPFVRDEVASWLRARYDLPSSELRILLNYLQEYAAGNALFLEELLHMMEKRGQLQQEEGRWKLRGLPEAKVPPLLQQLIAERVSRFSPQEQHLLQLAAVIGQMVPLELWQEVGEVSMETLWQVSEQGQARYLLDLLPEGRAVQFHHPLMWQVVLDTLSPPRRRNWHQRIAEYLLAQSPPPEEAIAAHLHEARDPRAVPWLRKVAEHAIKLGAALTAADLYEQLLHEAYASQLGTRERARLLISICWMRRWAYPESCLKLVNEGLKLARESEAKELVMHALACRALLHYILNEGSASMADARAVFACWQALSPEEQADNAAVLSIPPARCAAFDLLGLVMYLFAHYGYYQEVISLVEPLVRDLPAVEYCDIPESLRSLGFAMLFAAQALTYSALGRVEEATYAYSQSSRIYKALGFSINEGQNAQHELVWLTLPYLADRVERRVELAALARRRLHQPNGFFAGEHGISADLALWYSEGRWKEAYQLAEFLLSYTSAAVFGKGIVTGIFGLLTFLQGDYQRTWSLVHMVLPQGHASKPGQHHFFEVQAMQRLTIQLLNRENQPERARLWLEAYDRWLGWAGSVAGRAEGQLLWANYYQLHQERDRAYDCAQKSLQLASEVRQPLNQLAAQRFLAMLLREEQNLSPAHQHLEQAWGLAQACAMPYERALTLIERAELELAELQIEQAKTDLQEAEVICSELGALPALARCQDLAARLTKKQASSPRRPAQPSLTVREMEVVRLVAEGWSNQQIARQLYLSPGTVKRHLYNISQKLEARSRTQVVTISRQYGLLT